MDLSVGAGEQLAAWIIHVNLRDQGASRVGDGICGANQRALEFSTRKFGQSQIRRQARSGALGILFRDIYVDTQLSRLRNVKKISFHVSAVPGIDQVSDVGVTCGDDSLERRINLLERLQGLKLLHIGLICLE